MNKTKLNIVNYIVLENSLQPKKKKFKPNIPVVIHHEDGHRQLERVDLSQALRHEESSVQEQHSDADCEEDEQSVLVMEELEKQKTPMIMKVCQPTIKE